MKAISGRVGLGVRRVSSMIVSVVLVMGCASEKQKPMAQPSSEQVKGSADRAFERLKQEERERKPAGM